MQFIGDMMPFPKAGLLATLALVATFAATPAAARDGKIYAGVSAGSLGIGPELGYRFSRHLGARANASFFAFGFDIDTTERTQIAPGVTDVDGALYDVDVDLMSGGLMLDVFPTGSGFRVSAGVRYNGTKAHAEGTPQDRVRFSSTLVFTPSELGRVVGDFSLDEFAPALTVGYAGKFIGGMVFTVEAGALFQGKAKVSPLRFEGGMASAQILAMPVVQERLERERRELQEELDPYQVYPILQFGLGWRF